MEKTRKPTAAGILNIITGVLGIILAFYMFIGYGIVSSFGIPQPWYVPGIVLVPLLIGILAILGGIGAVRRKEWRWALVGSIAAIILFFPLGVPALILAKKSKNEFE